LKRDSYHDKRKAIVDSSFLLFFENGFCNVNLQMMLKQADVSKGTFYHYFKSKEGVIDSCYEHVVASFQAQINDVISSTELGLAEKLIFFIHLPSSYILLDTNGIRLSLAEFMLSSGNHELRRLFEKRYVDIIIGPLQLLLVSANQRGATQLTHPELSAKLLAMIMLPLVYEVPSLLKSAEGYEDDFNTLAAGLECIERTLKLEAHAMRDLLRDLQND
tara:strand:- start:2793 stop:3446 length:654 start_codon:yes stop_codon:yes gene_type:complete